MEIVIPQVIPDFAPLPLNILFSNTHVQYQFDIPGFETSELDVQITETRLFINACNETRLRSSFDELDILRTGGYDIVNNYHKLGIPHKGEVTFEMFKQFFIRKISKKFTIHKNLDISNVTMKYENGILYLLIKFNEQSVIEPRTLYFD